MPLELIADILLTLTKLPFVMALGATVLFFAVGKRLNQYIKEKYKLSWVASAFATTFIVLLPIVFALYLVPFLAGYAGSSLAGQLGPEFMQPTALDYAMAVISTIVKNLLTTFVFAVLLMLPVFLASFIEEKVKERFELPEIARVFISVFATALIVWIAVFFLMPWVYTGVLELLWWGL